MFGNSADVSHRSQTILLLRCRYGIRLLTIWLTTILSTATGSWAQDPPHVSPEHLAEEAKAYGLVGRVVRSAAEVR